MCRLLILSLACLGARLSVAASYLEDEPCGQDLGWPSQSLVQNCSDAYCIHATAMLLVCSCRRDPPPADEGLSADIVVRDGDREIQRWTEDFSLPSAPGTFRVSVADVDGDGRDDLVVATLNAISNGMAVEYWTVCAISGRASSAPPACVGVEDYGVMGYLTHGPGEHACLLLQTTWRWGTEPGRGNGLYLVGRWLRYSGSGFVPVTWRPILARRYLFSFQDERSSSSKPLAWLRNRTTRSVSCPDPLCD